MVRILNLNMRMNFREVLLPLVLAFGTACSDKQTANPAPFKAAPSSVVKQNVEREGFPASITEHWDDNVDQLIEAFHGSLGLLLNDAASHVASSGDAILIEDFNSLRAFIEKNRTDYADINHIRLRKRLGGRISENHKFPEGRFGFASLEKEYFERMGLGGQYDINLRTMLLMPNTFWTRVDASDGFHEASHAYDNAQARLVQNSDFESKYKEFLKIDRAIDVLGEAKGFALQIEAINGAMGGLLAKEAAEGRAVGFDVAMRLLKLESNDEDSFFSLARLALVYYKNGGYNEGRFSDQFKTLIANDYKTHLNVIRFFEIDYKNGKFQKVTY